MRTHEVDDERLHAQRDEQHDHEHRRVTDALQYRVCFRVFFSGLASSEYQTAACLLFFYISSSTPYERGQGKTHATHATGGGQATHMEESVLVIDAARADLVGHLHGCAWGNRCLSHVPSALAHV